MPSSVYFLVAVLAVIGVVGIAQTKARSERKEVLGRLKGDEGMPTESPLAAVFLDAGVPPPDNVGSWPAPGAEAFTPAPSPVAPTFATPPTPPPLNSPTFATPPAPPASQSPPALPLSPTVPPLPVSGDPVEPHPVWRHDTAATTVDLAPTAAPVRAPLASMPALQVEGDWSPATIGTPSGASKSSLSDIFGGITVPAALQPLIPAGTPNPLVAWFIVDGDGSGLAHELDAALRALGATVSWTDNIEALVRRDAHIGAIELMAPATAAKLPEIAALHAGKPVIRMSVLS